MMASESTYARLPYTKIGLLLVSMAKVFHIHLSTHSSPCLTLLLRVKRWTFSDLQLKKVMEKEERGVERWGALPCLALLDMVSARQK